MNSSVVIQTLLDAVLTQSRNDDVAAGLVALFAGFGLMLALVAFAFLAFTIYCWWRIFDKAGYGGVYSLMMLIPFFGPIIVLVFLAFGTWPALSQRTDTITRPGPT